MCALYRRTIFATALIVMAGLPTAASAELGPSKPSQLVNLFATRFSPTCGVAMVFRLEEQLPDGTRVPFVIPPKMVFIISSGFLQVDSPGASDSASLFMRNPANGNMAFVTGASFASGVGIERFTMPHGVVMKPGMLLCVTHDHGDDPVAALVQGYLAKDK